MTSLLKFDSYDDAAEWCEANAAAVVSVVVRYFPSHYEYAPNIGMMYVPPAVLWMGPVVPNWVRQANDAYYAWRDKWGFRVHHPHTSK